MGYFDSRDPTRGTFWASKKQTDAEDAAGQANKDWSQASQGVEKNLEGADSSYLGRMNGYTSEAQNSIKGLSADADAARKSSAQTYSTTIQPQLKNMMEQAQGNAAGAMSLQDAMDPNNKVASGVRDIYEKQAQNEDRRNLASTGMLQAMGQQNMATSLGSAGGPMTGGQLQALMATNQAQAGNAYARGQQRTQDLRDQGRDMGFQRSDTAYNQGLDAQDRYRRSVGDYESADTRQQANQAGYRNELGGYAGDTFNLGAGQAGLEHGTAASQAARQEAMLGRQYGTQISQANSIAAREAADREKKLDMMGGGAGGLMKMMGSAGGMFGGGKTSATDSGVSADKGGGDISAANQTAGTSGGSAEPNDYVSQSSQNGYTQGGYDPGYSTAGSSAGASGQMQTTGGMNLTNRMATRSISNPQQQGAAPQAPAAGRLGSLMAVPNRDWSGEQKAWQARQPQATVEGANQAAQLAAHNGAAVGSHSLHSLMKSMGGHKTPGQMADDERKKQAWVQKGYDSGRVSTY